MHHDPNSLAPYFVEEIRRYLENKYGSDQVHEGGLRVYTSLDMDLQRAANQAVLNGLAAYERRHGWKNHSRTFSPATMTLAHYDHPDWDDEPEVNGYVHALVTAVTPGVGDGQVWPLPRDPHAADAAWTRRKLPDIFKPGDLCYVKIVSLSDNGAAHVILEQDSGAQGALVAIDNATGEIKAMVGGRDFNARNSIAPRRRCGRWDRRSSRMFTRRPSIRAPARTTPILDAPISFRDRQLDLHSAQLRREVRRHDHAAARAGAVAQYSGAAAGGRHRDQDRHRLRPNASALLPTSRPICRSRWARPKSRCSSRPPPTACFPNDGVRIMPRYITKVTDYEGRVLEEDFPDVKDVISSRTARIMTSMLQEVVQHGTAMAASG